MKNLKAVPKSEVHGLALDLGRTRKGAAKNFPIYNPGASYVEAAAAAVLRDPCPYSCTFLISQIDKSWQWVPSFGIEGIQAEISGKEPASGRARDTPGAPAPAPAANPGAGLHAGMPLFSSYLLFFVTNSFVKLGIGLQAACLASEGHLELALRYCGRLHNPLKGDMEDEYLAN